jgi:hypothetical protein
MAESTFTEIVYILCQGIDKFDFRVRPASENKWRGWNFTKRTFLDPVGADKAVRNLIARGFIEVPVDPQDDD